MASYAARIDALEAIRPRGELFLERTTHAQRMRMFEAAREGARLDGGATWDEWLREERPDGQNYEPAQQYEEWIAAGCPE